MFDVQLFFGFPVDAIFAAELDKVNPALTSQYINDTGEFLVELKQDDMRFLGKKIEGIATLPQLELLETNIYSVLKKLIGDYPYEESPLYLFSIEKGRK